MTPKLLALLTRIQVIHRSPVTPITHRHPTPSHPHKHTSYYAFILICFHNSKGKQTKRETYLKKCQNKANNTSRFQFTVKQIGVCVPAPLRHSVTRLFYVSRRESKTAEVVIKISYRMETAAKLHAQFD